MKWYGMIWNDLKWYGMIWNDLKWCEMIWDDVKWYVFFEGQNVGKSWSSAWKSDCEVEKSREREAAKTLVYIEKNENKQNNWIEWDFTIF